MKEIKAMIHMITNDLDIKAEEKKKYLSALKKEYIEEQYKEAQLIMDIYKNVNVDEGRSLMIELLSAFIMQKVIKARFGSYQAQYQDEMLQEGKYGIIKAMDRYNPEISLPTTFFETYIVHEIGLFISQFVLGSTQYHASNENLIRKAIQELKKRGIKDPTAADIAEYTNLTVQKVEQDLEVINRKNVVYFSAGEDIEMSVPFGESTESNVLSRLEEETLNTALSKLSPDEQYVIKMYFRMPGFERVDNPEEIVKKTIETLKEEGKRVTPKTIAKFSSLQEEKVQKQLDVLAIKKAVNDLKEKGKVVSVTNLCKELSFMSETEIENILEYMHRSTQKSNEKETTSISFIANTMKLKAQETKIILNRATKKLQKLMITPENQINQRKKKQQKVVIGETYYYTPLEEDEE